jgi:hypothetical protein
MTNPAVNSPLDLRPPLPWRSAALCLVGIALAPQEPTPVPGPDRLHEATRAARGEASSGFGFAVAAVGDWDGDGRSDVAVGAPSNGQQSPGAVWVLSSASGAELAHFVGNEPGEEFGYALAGDLDWNGDQFPDLVVGVRSASIGGTRRGAVRFFSGRERKPLAAALLGVEDHAFCGASLARLDDGDGDGRPELAVGSPGESVGRGLVRVYAPGSTEPRLVLRGRGSGDGFGTSVAAARDMNGDGHDDVLVGVPRESRSAPGSGAVRVFDGRNGRTLRTLWGTEPHGAFGERVAALGDVDGDGCAEFAVSSPSLDFADQVDVGRVEVFDGRSGLRLYLWDGPDSGGFFGRGLAGGLDVDGDGAPDLAVGAPYALRQGATRPQRSGAVSVYSGRTGLLLQTLSRAERGEFFGWSLAVLPRADDAIGTRGLAIGAPGRRESRPDPGDPEPRPGHLRLAFCSPLRER